MENTLVRIEKLEYADRITLEPIAGEVDCFALDSDGWIIGRIKAREIANIIFVLGGNQ